MSWFLVMLFLSLTLGSFSEDNHHKKLPSAVVVGTVYCDTCSQHDFSFGSHFISGASVAIECKDGNSKPRFKNEVKTNEHGEFKVELPFSVSKHAKRIKGCTFKLLSSSEPYCAVASSATSTSLSLKSRNQGEHIFSAGFFSFKPLNKPKLCNQKPSIQNTKGKKTEFPSDLDPSFPPPLQDPPTPGILPPLPRVPGLSPLPPLPAIPLLPPPPVQGKVKESNPIPEKSHFSDEKFFFPPNPFLPPPIIPIPFLPPPIIPIPFLPPPIIPIPFQPPPLIPNPLQPPPLIPNPFQPPPLIPNPFQPPSPPPLIPNPFQPPSPPPLIPNPLQPPPSSPSPLFPFPPIPGLTPSPPPSPPPVFPFPLPPLFPPPISPGRPPASSLQSTSP